MDRVILNWIKIKPAPSYMFQSYKNIRSHFLMNLKELASAKCLFSRNLSTFALIYDGRQNYKVEYG